MNKKLQRWVLTIILLALALRICLFIIALLHPERMMATDSGGYLDPARSLLDSGYYSYPSAIRMPLYPVFIAVVFKIFPEQLIFIVLVQVILGLCTVYITYRTGLLLGISHTASILSALILSLSLESLISPFFILTETLFTFLLVLTTWVFILFIKNGRLIWLVSASLLTGVVTLCRPIALAFAAVGVVILLMNNHQILMNRFVHAIVYIGLLIVLFLVPWTLRNEQVVGVCTLTTESDLYWLWGAATLDADARHIPVDQAYMELDQATKNTLTVQGLAPTEANLSRVIKDTAQKKVFAHLGRFIILTLRYDVRSLLPGVGFTVNYLGLSKGNTGGIELIQSQGIEGVFSHYFNGQPLSIFIFVPFIMLLAVTFLGALMGIWDLVKKHDWLALVLIIVTASYFLLLPGYSANSRYRVPAMPYIALLAGTGLNVIWAGTKLRFEKRIKLRNTLPE